MKHGSSLVFLGLAFITASNAEATYSCSIQEMASSGRDVTLRAVIGLVAEQSLCPLRDCTRALIDHQLSV